MRRSPFLHLLRVAPSTAILLAAAGPPTGASARPVTTRSSTAVIIRLPEGATPPPAGSTYVAPVEPLVVLRGFDPPATRYGAGHLGVDLRAPAGGVVHAAGAGTVTFAGQVAGRGLVVIQHADGVRTEYEPVTPLVAVGAVVRRGQPVGSIRGTHRGCPGQCLHWGARRGENYLDPLTLLRPLGPVRLLPWQTAR